MFSKIKKPINVDMLFEVSNDNKVNLDTNLPILEESGVILFRKQEFIYYEDAWDNIHGDNITFD